jgi:hypothetical protein
MPEPVRVGLDKEKVEADGRWSIADDELWSRAKAREAPEIGDPRIRYEAVPNSVEVTLFARADGDRLLPYHAHGVTRFRAFQSDRESALQTRDTEFRIWRWVLRLGGMLMMWFGLMLGLGPINALLNIVPAVGNAGGCMIGAMTLAVAVTLSVATMLLSIIAHNLFLLIGVLVVVLVAVILRGWCQRGSLNLRRRGS